MVGLTGTVRLSLSDASSIGFWKRRLKVAETILRTNRTVIDRISLEDAEFFVRLLNTSEWLQFIGDRQVRCLDDAIRYLQDGFLKCYRDHRFGYYMVKSIDQIPMGICGFLRKSMLENPDFGFAFLPEFCGQGYALEAGRSVLRYGVEVFGFSVIDAVVTPENVQSRRLLARLDFCQHDTLDSDFGREPLMIYRLRVEGQPAARSRI